MKSYTKRELLSPIGHLQHVGKVVKPWCTFWDTWLTWQQRLKNFTTTIGSTRGFNRTTFGWQHSWKNGMDSACYPPSHTCHQINPSHLMHWNLGLCSKLGHLLVCTSTWEDLLEGTTSHSIGMCNVGQILERPEIGMPLWQCSHGCHH